MSKGIFGAGRDAAAGCNARALHPGLLPASSRRSLSDRKIFPLGGRRQLR
ncbi:MAG: hypothetical protein LBQ54_02095 [Planctomycetaceae bacterium]|nr:hypothetical protein [Planctomycetaceae bacterium]